MVRTVAQPLRVILNISRTLVETALDFVLAKCSLWWEIEKCGGLILCCFPRNPREKAGEEEGIKLFTFKKLSRESAISLKRMQT